MPQYFAHPEYLLLKLPSVGVPHRQQRAIETILANIHGAREVLHVLRFGHAREMLLARSRLLLSLPRLLRVAPPFASKFLFTEFCSESLSKHTAEKITRRDPLLVGELVEDAPLVRREKHLELNRTIGGGHVLLMYITSTPIASGDSPRKITPMRKGERFRAEQLADARRTERKAIEEGRHYRVVWDGAPHPEAMRFR
jgi:hypothetical protein